MKAVSIRSFLILISVTLLLSACQKDEDLYIPVENDFYTTHIFGTVTDQEGSAIANATVEYRGKSTTSDGYGTYLLTDVLVDSRHNHLTIHKEGFFPHTRTFRSAKSEMIVQHSELLALDFKYSAKTNLSSVIADGTISVEFDGKGMILKSNQEPYAGDVEVAMVYLDPLDVRIGDYMPGDLTARDENNRFRVLESFGMMGVELRTPDGRALQLSEESTAIISADIPSELLQDAPDEIPMWHFDPTSGFWVEEGVGKRVGNSYTAEVSHFSFWNFDIAREPIMLRGRITDSNGIGLASLKMKVLRPNEQRGASGVTDFDGYFDGPVEKGAVLELRVVSKCDEEEVVYTEQVGPFEKDTELGDIVLDIPNVEYLTIKGNFINCDDESIAEGLLQINGQGRPQLFPVLGGSIDKTFGICNLGLIELLFIDRNKLNFTSLGTYDLPNMVDLETRKVCGETVNFATINTSTYDLDLVLVDSISFTQIGTSKSILAFDYSYEQAVLEIKYVDQDANGIELGTHNILKMVCNFRFDETSFEIVLLLQEGSITIEDVDESNRIVKGSYSFEAEIDVLDETHLFEGAFQSNY